MIFGVYVYQKLPNTIKYVQNPKSFRKNSIFGVNGFSQIPSLTVSLFTVLANITNLTYFIGRLVGVIAGLNHQATEIPSNK